MNKQPAKDDPSGMYLDALTLQRQWEAVRAKLYGTQAKRLAFAEHLAANLDALVASGKAPAADVENAARVVLRIWHEVIGQPFGAHPPPRLAHAMARAQRPAGRRSQRPTFPLPT